MCQHPQPLSGGGAGPQSEAIFGLLLYVPASLTELLQLWLTLTSAG